VLTEPVALPERILCKASFLTYESCLTVRCKDKTAVVQSKIRRGRVHESGRLKFMVKCIEADGAKGQIKVMQEGCSHVG
jgi:hypothetical protein